MSDACSLVVEIDVLKSVVEIQRSCDSITEISNTKTIVEIPSSVSAIQGKDIASGVYFIPFGRSLDIPENSQSVNFGGLDVEGDILNDGQLIMED